ncbi:hypothetical protein [Flavilitoribacter nigricans]|uniref:Uncharacterized protein n=1 Tax=Flavilitoribacter nigricans (strain ATCC 23147 / DSM 23189 / NBRC 102662 / NCIMB 1420 / SS-2) TaxID=1122177 RepID=A0A2D0N9D0_FLAN2|nr:hypothetical protein [Flavilitoribacter nigricans]PHN05087.1 hypothetical protein CRP01_18865 [Flavilitoribacter nigricans DSM 23189 = NBRC 102662]
MLNNGSRAWFFLVIVLSVFGTACHSDQAVDIVADRFQIGYQDAFMAGAGPLSVFSSLPARLDSIGKLRDLLVAVDTHYLSRQGKDRKQELEVTLSNEWARWAPYRADPSLYNIGGLLKKSLTQSVNDLPEERLQELAGIMEQADAYYAAARRNLVVADVSLYRLASQKQYLGLEFLREELQDSLRTFDLSPETRQQFRQQIRRTELSLKDYMGFCESVYLNFRDSTHYQPEAQRKTIASDLQ